MRLLNTPVETCRPSFCVLSTYQIKLVEVVQRFAVLSHGRALDRVAKVFIDDIEAQKLLGRTDSLAWNVR
jgi:hypothetical protein